MRAPPTCSNWPMTSCEGAEWTWVCGKGVTELEGADRSGGLEVSNTHDAVLLDLFGTLVDFQSVFLYTLKRVLVDHDLMARAEEFRTRWQRFVFQGQSDGEFITVKDDFIRSLKTVLESHDCDGDLHSYSKTVITDMFEGLRQADLFPEVPAVIASIEGASIPWGVVSNVDEVDLQAILTNQRFRPTIVVSSERVRSYKPEGHIFLTALEELSLPASRVVHVGDSPLADVAGATRAGLGTVWVNRYGGKYPLDLPAPGWTMTELSGLPGLLLGD